MYNLFQVEGAWNVGGKGWSNWDYMTEHEPGLFNLSLSSLVCLKTVNIKYKLAFKSSATIYNVVHLR